MKHTVFTHCKNIIFYFSLRFFGSVNNSEANGIN